MSEEKAQEISENESSSNIAQFFFNPNESYWPFLTVLVAISIFSIWTIRSAFPVTYALGLILAYSVISMLSTRFKFSETNVSQVDKKITFAFRRSGVSWKVLLQALLGAAIPILLTWFVLFNSIPDSKEPAELIMLLAMLLYIGIVPITPALSAIPQLNILKTSVTSVVAVETYAVLEFGLNANPLDGYWYDHREDSELISALENTLLSSLREYVNGQTSIEFS